MKNATTVTVAALCIALSALPAAAIPPHVCRLRAEGYFVARGGTLSNRVAVRLHMRSDENDVSFQGSIRCTNRDQSRCFVPPRSYFDAFLDSDDVGPRFAYRTGSFKLRRKGMEEVACELEGTTPFVRSLCPGSIGGTFVCAPHDEFEELSGQFGFTVDTCKPCVNSKPRTPHFNTRRR